nr:hypothetical protein [uncultured Flavobacterium sp.]
MQVEIFKDIFNDNYEHSHLDNLLSLFKEDRHFFVIDDSEQIETCISSTWYSGLSKRDIKIVKESIVRSSRKVKNKLKIIVSNDGNNPDYFGTKEAYLYLNQPLNILVENSEYEPPFINAIIRNFDYSGEIKYAKDELWLKFSNGGGSSIEGVLRGEMQNSFNNIVFTKSKEKYLRYFVIKDSDKKYKEEVLPISKSKFLDDYGIDKHILYKREKENYISNNIYESFIYDHVKKNYANSFLRLNNDQKDFLDIEKGFSYFNSVNSVRKVKEKETLEEEVLKLFDNISNSDYLNVGIGFSVSFPGFKSNFSKKFDVMSKEDMYQRIKHQPKIRSEIDDIERNEFDHIVNEIKRLL